MTGSPSASRIHALGSITEPLDFSRLFPRPQPVEADLGSGDGSFLIEYAAAHPETNFIGIERLLGRLRKIDRKALRAGIDNLRLVRLEADYLLRYLVPAGTLRAIHIYFPDPWPKRRHRPRRLVNAVFTEAAFRALEPGGRIYLRTDDEDYARQMQTVFAAHPGFSARATPPELAGFTTDFERDFQRLGRPIFHAAFEKNAGPSFLHEQRE